jgi:hypothetical protein
VRAVLGQVGSASHAFFRRNHENWSLCSNHFGASRHSVSINPRLVRLQYAGIVSTGWFSFGLVSTIITKPLKAGPIYDFRRDPGEQFDMAFNGAMPTHGNQTSPGRYSGSDNGWIGILVMPPLVQFFEGTQNTPQPSLRALRRSGDRTHLERAAIAPTIWSHECSLSRYGKALWSLLDNNFDLRGALSLLPIVRIFLTD